MKRNLALFLILLFFLPSLACGSFRTNSVIGSGKTVTQPFDVSNFSRVTLEGFGDVFIEQGKTESVSVETDDNIIPLLDIQVRGNELILGIKRGMDLNPSESITYNLTVKNLNDIKLAGSGTFHVGPLQSENFGLSIPGSGDINISSITAESLSLELNGSGNITLEDVDAKSVDTSLSGSGDITLDGKTNTQQVEVNGSGNYAAGNLRTDKATVSIPGSGNITVWVEDELNIVVSGSGNIRYYGKPVLDQRISGSGDITSLGEK